MAEVYARLNWGRWIADCPHCNGAELVYPGEPFICGNVDCSGGDFEGFKILQAIRKAEAKGHAKVYNPVDGIPVEEVRASLEKNHAKKMITVIFPDKKAQIEQLTNKRPEKARNWPVKDSPCDFDEDIQELINENDRHGVK